MPHRPQPVEPRHQRRVEAGGDGKRRQEAIQHVMTVFLAQQPALQDALGHFLDKQRHAISALYDPGKDLVG
jgi:hypothetical protein